MKTKTCDHCGRFVEDRGFSMKDLIFWTKEKMGHSLGDRDFCSLGCFVDWTVKNLTTEKE